MKAIARLPWVVLLAASAASAASPPGASNPEHVNASSRGLLYGRVTMASGTVFEGRLRWGDEEASWIDFFNSAKIENPWHEAAGLERTPRRIEVFGVKLPYAADPSQETRQFIARFGDIRRIEVGQDERAIVTMKSGVTYLLQDGSNDIGADIVVWDAKAGEQRLRWMRIASIDFLPTPPSLRGPARLYGTVRSRDGEFTGPLQWNMHECLATDVLHGDSEEARMQIPFAEIRSLDRDSDSAVKIDLADGRHLQLTASADNGVFVDDSRFGRVLVGWQAVQHIDFLSPRDSPAYGDFPPGRPLAGSVTDRAGKSYRGRLVFDLDEAETWEFLNGNHLTQHRTKPQWPVRGDDPSTIQYSIPIPFVAAVVPIDNESARLLFHDGREITLEGETDVGEWNGGMLIYEAGAPKPVYIEWKNVQRVDFEK